MNRRFFKDFFSIDRIIVLLLFFPLFSNGQDVPEKKIKDGWAIYFGSGYLYGGNLGIKGEKQFSLNEKFRISPLVSLGVAEGEEDTTLSRNYWLGFSAGANLEYGKQHRLVFGPQFVFQNTIGRSLIITKDQLYGASLIIGYKGTANFGLIWEVYIGDIYIQDPTAASKKFAHSSQVGAGLGYKF